LCEQAGLIAALIALAVLHRQLVAAEADGAVGQRDDHSGEDDRDAEAEQQEAEPAQQEKPAHPAPTSAPRAEAGTTQRRVVLDFDVMYEIAANITDKHRREGLQLFARQMKEAQARELAEARFV
jgi:hypothetical protein